MFFENIKIFDGKAYNLEYHEASIKNTLKAPFLFDIKAELSDAPTDGEKIIKAIIAYNQKGELTDKQFLPYIKKDIKTIKFINADDLVYDKKYTKRSAINSALENSGVDEVVFIKNGFVTDTSSSNIAILLGRKWVTPKDPLIYGTTRSRLLKRNLITEKNITKEDLMHAKEIAILNAMDDFRILENITFVDSDNTQTEELNTEVADS